MDFKKNNKKIGEDVDLQQYYHISGKQTRISLDAIVLFSIERDDGRMDVHTLSSYIFNIQMVFI